MAGSPTDSQFFEHLKLLYNDFDAGMQYSKWVISAEYTKRRYLFTALLHAIRLEFMRRI